MKRLVALLTLLVSVAVAGVGSFMPLNQVISLHRTNPELFAWCDNV